MRSLLAAAILLWAYSTAVARQPDVDSGNYFLPACKAFASETFYENALDEGVCAGVVKAVSQVGKRLDPKWRSCTPGETTLAQRVRVVISFLEAHPERLHEDFTPLAVEALRQAWPCGR